MLSNANEPNVQKKIAAQCALHPCLQRVIDAVQNSPDSFRLLPATSGLTLAADNSINGKPNRGLLKIFFPNASNPAAVFYKQSLLAASRDRYSYGGIEIDQQHLDDKVIGEWLAFLHTGFAASTRPPRFQRTFLYDLPDD